MATIKEKLEALREHYGSVYKLAWELNWPVGFVEEWLKWRAGPHRLAQDAINRLYDELKEGE